MDFDPKLRVFTLANPLMVASTEADAHTAHWLPSILKCDRVTNGVAVLPHFVIHIRRSGASYAGRIPKVKRRNSIQKVKVIFFKAEASSDANS